MLTVLSVSKHTRHISSSPRPLSRLAIVKEPGSGAHGRAFLVSDIRGATSAPRRSLLSSRSGTMFFCSSIVQANIAVSPHAVGCVIGRVCQFLP
jgi:hypothetical protein